MKTCLLLLALIGAVTVRLPAADTLAPADVSSPFSIRGTLPWHNFLSGPTAWNEPEYRAYLDELQQHGLNFVGFHCYTGGAERYAPYVEPMIRVKYRDVLPEAGFDTSLTARWGYRPLALRDFVFGTSHLFPSYPEAEAFGADCALNVPSNEQRYAQAQALMRKVMEMAHARGIQVAMGFEFGVHPPELASIVPPDSRIPGAMLPDPTHPANIEILQSELEDVLRAYPGVDWIWLWLHEHSMFVAQPELSGRFRELYEREKANFGDAKEHDVFTGVWSLAQIRQVHEYLARRSPNTKLVIGGWGGGPQLPPVLRGLDRALPTNIVFSCLNSGSHAPVLAEIASHRQTWSIPWFESDGSLWHLQLRAGSVSAQVKAAYVDHLAGVVGIHWRTEEIRPNLEAFATTARDPEHAPSGLELYQSHCARRYGPLSAQELAPWLLRFENEHELGQLPSPEFYPYHPSWGRLPGGLSEKLQAAIALIDRLNASTSLPTHRANLDWLGDNLRFTLLLDEVGRRLEPAYRLKEQCLLGAATGAMLTQEAHAARRELAAAPIQDLFQTFSRRVRSRGELGEMSSLNQKLWLQYRELDQFLTQAEK
jgi:hypothetical protein